MIGTEAHHDARPGIGQPENLFLPVLDSSVGQGVHIVIGNIQMFGQSLADLPAAAAIFPCNRYNHLTAPLRDKNKFVKIITIFA